MNTYKPGDIIVYNELKANEYKAVIYYKINTLKNDINEDYAFAHFLYYNDINGIKHHIYKNNKNVILIYLPNYRHLTEEETKFINKIMVFK